MCNPPSISGCYLLMRATWPRGPERDPEALVQQLMILKEGAIVIAHFGHTRDPAGEAKAAAEVLVASQIS